MSIKEQMAKQFKENYAEQGVLPYLRIDWNLPGKRILMVSGELGDDQYGPSAMMDFARLLIHEPSQSSSFDIVPVLDLEGYPDNRTVLGYEGMGNPMYLNTAYTTKDRPEQLKGLEGMMKESDYELAVLFRTVHKEDYPAVNGYFGFTQVRQDDEKQKLDFPIGARELVLSIGNRFGREGLPVHMPSDGPYLGDGHVVIGPGFVVQGLEVEEEGEQTIKYSTRDGFLRVAQSPAAVLNIISSKVRPEEYDTKRAYQIALDTVKQIYR